MRAMLPLVREIVRLDRSGVELGFGVRCTAGVAIPLVAAYAAGVPLDGVSAAFGAMAAGFASRQGVYRTRAAAMLLTAAAMAVSACVGAFAGGLAVLYVVVVALWGLGLGIVGVLGASATTAGLNSVIAILVFANPPFGPSQALPQASLVFVGGVVQSALLVLVWPLQRFTAERRVLAAAYDELAEYGEHLPSARLGSPAPLGSVFDTLADPQPFARRGEIAAFAALLEHAQRIRGTLAALAVVRYALEERRDDAAARRIATIGEHAAVVLREIAASLRDARAPGDLQPRWHAIDRQAESLDGLALTDARALLGQLRAAWRAAAVPAERAGTSPVRPRAASPFAISALGEALQTLRANLSPRSVYAQHALRLAVVLGLGALAARTLPLQRGYWIPLTSVIVLRPDFTTTFRIGLGRVGGTIAGALLASGVASVVHPGHAVYLVLTVAFAGVGYALFAVNYAIFALAITGYVVFLLALAGSPEHSAAVDRVVATALGALLALVAYALRPSWSREQVPDALADLIDAQRRYVALLLRASLEGAASAESAIAQAQRDAWRARSAAEAAVDQMVAEPVQPRTIRVRTALGILAMSRRFAAASLTLHAHLALRAPDEREALGTLAASLDQAMAVLVAALRARPLGVPELPPLRERQIVLKRALDAHPNPDLEALVAETDLFVDSLATMADVLRRNALQLSTGPG